MPTGRAQSVFDAEQRGSSKSLQKTISEIDALLEGKQISADGDMRAELHAKIFKLLFREAIYWYKQGFKISHHNFRRHGIPVPLTISARVLLRGTPYFPENGVVVNLDSTLNVPRRRSNTRRN
jgi:hypothetical protein